mgnify:FL=1
MAPDAYDDLLRTYGRVFDLDQSRMALSWDQQVVMPSGGTPARSSQLSTLSSLHHDELTSDAVSDALNALDGADLSDDEAAVVREIRRDYERANPVPRELVEKHAELSADAQEVWHDAKSEDDFEAYAPVLSDLRDLRIERAECVDPEKPPYEVMFDDGEPDLPMSTVEEIFDDLRETIVPLVDEIREDGDDLADPFTGEFDTETQEALSRDALDFLGYDWDRGRLDTSAHPFTSGNQFDARVTTRFKPRDPLDALTATIHEFGHATYMLGLPDDEYGTPLGEARSSGVHESQSRFWENHVGRTRAFWEAFLPTVKEHFPSLEDATPEEAYQAANAVDPNNLIRVEADELTYHMHIILRAEIEADYVAGDLAVEDIPDAWNAKMEEYLGVTPDTDSDGCLQDIHWTTRFAGFQSYTLGSVIAAQLDAALREDVDIEGCIRDGDLEPVHEWLTTHVHEQGKRYTTPDLIEHATGDALTADYFLDYAESKFRDLYGL